MKKVLWVSGITEKSMTEDQIAALGENVVITEHAGSLRNMYEIQDKIREADMVAMVGTTALQQQAVKIAGSDIPVLVAKSERLVVSEGEYEFKFMNWNKINDIGEIKQDYVPDQSRENTNVLWLSRHPLSEEQIAALGDNINVMQVDKTIQSVDDIKEDIDKADVVAAVLPLDLKKDVLEYAGDKPFISAKMNFVPVLDENGDPVIGPNGRPQSTPIFDKWEQTTEIVVDIEAFDIEKETKLDNIRAENAHCSRSTAEHILQADEILNNCTEITEDVLKKGFEQAKEEGCDKEYLALIENGHFHFDQDGKFEMVRYGMEDLDLNANVSSFNTLVVQAEYPTTFDENGIPFIDSYESVQITAENMFQASRESFMDGKAQAIFEEKAVATYNMDIGEWEDNLQDVKDDIEHDDDFEL